MNEERITIGERVGGGGPQLFGILIADQRQHIYVIGKTGSGKSTLLRNMIIQHIEQGHGIGLIDPHGDLAEEILGPYPAAPLKRLGILQPRRLGISCWPQCALERRAR